MSRQADLSSPSKGDQLRRGIAEYLLTCSIGDRVPSIRSLAEAFGASIGATQAVLAGLERAGAIVTTRRGRNGTAVAGRSLGKLWAAAREEPLVIALPLPSTRRVHALATALKSALIQAEVEAYLEFIRGSRQRLVALRSGRCHAAAMSTLAAEGLMRGNEVKVVELRPGTYVREHRVFHGAVDSWPARPRIGIDTDSYDFELLSELEFTGDIVKVQGTYMHLMELLRHGEIDAMIMDVEEAFAPAGPEINQRPLSQATLKKLAGKNTATALVSRTSERSVRHLLSDCLADSKVQPVLEEVLKGQRNPEY